MGEPQTADLARLIGKWYGRVDGEPVGLEFLPDGRLAYVVLSGDRAQTVRMTYRLDANYLITDQASAPHEERTRFRFEGPDRLVLEFGGVATNFTKQ